MSFPTKKNTEIYQGFFKGLQEVNSKCTLWEGHQENRWNNSESHHITSNHTVDHLDEWTGEFGTSGTANCKNCARFENQWCQRWRITSQRTIEKSKNRVRRTRKEPPRFRVASEIEKEYTVKYKCLPHKTPLLLEPFSGRMDAIS